MANKKFARIADGRFVADVEFDETTLLAVADLPAKVTCWHDEAKVESGDALTIGLAATLLYNLRVYQTTALINDKLSWNIKLRPGVYTFNWLARKDSNMGIATWRLDTTEIAEFDTYDAAGTQHMIFEQTAINVTGGEYVLSMEVTGKNEFSSGYMVQAVKAWFRQTGDLS